MLVSSTSATCSNIGTETTTNWIVWAFTRGLSFAGGVYIILSGVRLIIGEIVPAFKGIAQKLVPGAKPAIDCPIAFTYAPNAVIIGFLSSFVGGILGLLILGVINAQIAAIALILPGVVPSLLLRVQPQASLVTQRAASRAALLALLSTACSLPSCLHCACQSLLSWASPPLPSPTLTSPSWL